MQPAGVGTAPAHRRWVCLRSPLLLSGLFSEPDLWLRCRNDGPDFSIPTLFLLSHSHLVSLPLWTTEKSRRGSGLMRFAFLIKQAAEQQFLQSSKCHSVALALGFIPLQIHGFVIRKTTISSLRFQTGMGACNESCHQACLPRSRCRGAISAGGS